MRRAQWICIIVFQREAHQEAKRNLTKEKGANMTFQQMLKGKSGNGYSERYYVVLDGFICHKEPAKKQSKPLLSLRDFIKVDFSNPDEVAAYEALRERIYFNTSKSYKGHKIVDSAESTNATLSLILNPNKKESK